jgi:hypothetical protein|uniref:Uncharacterized protein n=1 Tax=Siphoviridae sp. ctUWs1 TaxID=2826352 RepID=A0A8S5QTD1_9CAUD|nr:MAG TPA: hypothetical protein [Siphoviridae sp. ctUWs1]
MPGPSKPFLSPEGARGGQYVTVPAFASPGHSSPSNTRDAPGSTIVYSPKGWRWEEAGDDYSKTVSKLTAATMESAVRRIKTSMGEVFYIRGTADTVPPFGGSSVGDTCRVQDAQTLDIVAEWKWDGASWERMRVTSEQISNLDVGKLTAGAANIAEITARKIASDVGRFLEITTDQLTVTGNASFVNATAHHVWTEIMTAGEGEFEHIKAGMLDANSVNASNIQAGAIDGQVITGATVQTSRNNNEGIKIDPWGIRAYKHNSKRVAFSVNAATGSVYVDGDVGITDSWSKARFVDIVEVLSGNDVGQKGDRWGVGLEMNKTSAPYKYSALVTFKEDPTNRGGILYFQAPSNEDNGTPNMRLSNTGLQVYGGRISTWSMSASKSGFAAGAAGKASISINNYSSSIGMNGNVPFEVRADALHLKTVGNHWKGFWAHDKATAMGWTKDKQAIVDDNGFRAVGGKTFIMRVPGEWQKRKKMLQHCCTESPYDGLEYWENVTLDADGRATWVLPDYIPKIASPAAPWVVLTSSTATATLNRTGYGTDAYPWSVDVLGKPGETVSVLVKGARQIDNWDPDTDIVDLRDRALESVWVDPPDLAPPDMDDIPRDEWGVPIPPEDTQPEGENHG